MSSINFNPNIPSYTSQTKKRQSVSSSDFSKLMSEKSKVTTAKADEISTSIKQQQGLRELTEEEINQLSAEYDVHNLTDEKKKELLEKLRDMNVISDRACRLSSLNAVRLYVEVVTTESGEKEIHGLYENGKLEKVPDDYKAIENTDVLEMFKKFSNDLYKTYYAVKKYTGKDDTGFLEDGDIYNRLAGILQQLERKD